jgi:hypothetical protein
LRRRSMRRLAPRATAASVLVQMAWTTTARRSAGQQRTGAVLARGVTALDGGRRPRSVRCDAVVSVYQSVQLPLSGIASKPFETAQLHSHVRW